MTETFYNSATISKETLRGLMIKSNNPALVRFLVLAILFTLSVAWCLMTWGYGLISIVISQVLFGFVGCSFFACEHECIHNTAFKSRWMNRVAAFLAGIAHLYPSGLFRELHFTHHRYAHVPGKDPEISLGNRPVISVVSNLPSYLSWLSGIPLLLFKILMTICGALGMPEFIRKNLFPFVNPKSRAIIAFECLLVILIYLIVIFLAINYEAGFWSIIIGQFVAHCFLTTFVTAEHNGLPHEGNIMEKTRTTETNFLVKLMMWNMPYHSEHHAYPAVPFHSLPQLHKEMKSEIKNFQPGYPDFHVNVLARLLKR